MVIQEQAKIMGFSHAMLTSISFFQILKYCYTQKKQPLKYKNWEVACPD